MEHSSMSSIEWPNAETRSSDASTNNDDSPLPDSGDWVMSPCDDGDHGATRVVLAHGTESYTPSSPGWR
jgi:hypothetical protein